VIVGGRGNSIQFWPEGNNVIVGGQYSSIEGQGWFNTMIGGMSNRLFDCLDSYMMFGEQNSVSNGWRSGAIGGSFNAAGSQNSATIDSCIAWASQSTIAASDGEIATNCFVLGSDVSDIHSAEYSWLLGGTGNSVGATGGGERNFVIGGQDHELGDGAQSTGIVGGESHRVDGPGTYSALLLGGLNNAINLPGGSFSSYPVVTGGEGNVAAGNWSVVSGGLNRSTNGDHDWAAGSLYEDN
jgi:hypothetical protein